MVVINTLEKVNSTELTKAYTLGFSDYQISLSLNEENLENTLKKNGYEGKSSVGLFEEHELVGFVLNGVRGNYGYTLGIAIIPHYRGNGYARLLLAETLSLFSNQNIHTWVLEVLSDNTKAIRLYQSIGFTQQRLFNCYSIQAETIKTQETGITLTRQQRITIPYGECLPSWQHEEEAIKIEGSPTWDIMAKKRKVGTLCYDPETGSIVQIHIQDEERRKGYARQTIIEAANLCKAEQLRFVRIDARYLPLNNLLETVGFACFATQLEMTNIIRGRT